MKRAPSLKCPHCRAVIHADFWKRVAGQLAAAKRVPPSKRSVNSAACPHCGTVIDRRTWISRGAALSAASNGHAGRKKVQNNCQYCGEVIDGARELRAHQARCPMARRCSGCRRKLSVAELTEHRCK